MKLMRIAALAAAVLTPTMVSFADDNMGSGTKSGSTAKVDKDEFMKKFIGTWDIDEGYDQGREIPEEELEGTTTVITKDSITTYDRDKKETYKATYKLDFSHEPVHIDMTATMEGRTMIALGIIEFEYLDLDGDNEFTLAYSLKPGERPENFESPVGSKIMVMEMEQDDD